jgi:hypothetical protein
MLWTLPVREVRNVTRSRRLVALSGHPDGAAAAIGARDEVIESKGVCGFYPQAAVVPINSTVPHTS